jgi:hypothetical protein
VSGSGFLHGFLWRNSNGTLGFILPAGKLLWVSTGRSEAMEQRMAAEPRAKRIAQVCVYSVLSISLAMVVFSSPMGRHLIGSDYQEEQVQTSRNPPPTDRRPLARNPHDSRFGRELIRSSSMPAYQDARDRLRRLNRARTDLLQAAVENRVDQLNQASEDYRTSVQDFRDAVGQLRDRVEPQMYPHLVGRLMADRSLERSWQHEFPVSEERLADHQREAIR